MLFYCACVITVLSLWLRVVMILLIGVNSLACKMDKESAPSGGITALSSAEMRHTCTHVHTCTHMRVIHEEHEGSLKISCNIKAPFLNLVKNGLDSHVSLFTGMKTTYANCPLHFCSPLHPCIAAFISMLLSFNSLYLLPTSYYLSLWSPLNGMKSSKSHGTAVGQHPGDQLQSLCVHVHVYVLISLCLGIKLSPVHE